MLRLFMQNLVLTFIFCLILCFHAQGFFYIESIQACDFPIHNRKGWTPGAGFSNDLLFVWNELNGNNTVFNCCRCPFTVSTYVQAASFWLIYTVLHWYDRECMTRIGSTWLRGCNGIDSSISKAVRMLVVECLCGILFTQGQEEHHGNIMLKNKIPMT